MKAVDLYAGIGGWSVGLKLAGIKVVASYEWWDEANATHAKNLGSNVIQADIRELPLSAFPQDADVVVGSPPCTQFSYANRGGSGDIDDGFKDIRKFFEVVDHIKPRFWAMENVPRVASLLSDLEIRAKVLGKLSYLLDNAAIEVVDCSEFGVPQKRKRCIAGNFDFDLMASYKRRIKQLALGDVVMALEGETICDPSYPINMPREKVTGLRLEAPLNSEELRMNRDAKTFHTVYNNMPFPDPLDVASRTITATCTRVSRESVIVEFPKACGRFRRLSVRERAVAQGFPLFYQFHGSSYTSQLKMIGNAVPPNLTYAIANSMRSVPTEKFVPTQNVRLFQYSEIEAAPEFEPETPGRKFRAQRSFAAAIPALRFKSGMRFEMNNAKGASRWSVQFFFGDSKRINSLLLDQSVADEILTAHKNDKIALKALKNLERHVSKVCRNFDHDIVQAVWTGVSEGTHPHDLVDALGTISSEAIKSLSDHECGDVVEAIILRRFGGQGACNGLQKVLKYATEVLVGLYVGSLFNVAVGIVEPSAAPAAKNGAR